MVDCLGRYAPLVLLISLVHSGGFLTSCRNRAPAGSAVRGDENIAPVGGEQAVTFQTIRSIIETDKQRTVEGVLQKLPKSFLASHVILFESDSSQSATPAKPRVILYSPGARFMMTFNSVTSDGGDKFETIEFRPSDGKFVFREIEFPPLSDVTSPVKVSADNPPACRACHRSQMRPIFDTWPEWPIAYFGKVIGPTGAVHDQRQVDDFASFQLKAATDTRYSLLENLAAYTQKDFQDAGGSAAILSGQILDRIDDMIAGEIVRHPKYDRWKVALHGAAFGCAQFTEWIPKADLEGQTVTLDSVRQATLNANPKASEITVRLRWLFELVGKDIKQWSPHPTVFFNFQRGLDVQGPFPGVPLARVSNLGGQLKDDIAADIAADSRWTNVCSKLHQLGSAQP